MYVESVESRPFHRIPYLNAARRGGVESTALPLLRGRVDRLPDGLDAILVASDLQGVAPDWRAGNGWSRLLGEELADTYRRLGDDGVVPVAARTGVVLAGDLYSVPEANKRGGHGDVRSVWQAFARNFRWVVGVEGNHDGFGTDAQRARFEQEPRTHLLDGEVVRIDGLTFGGVGELIGRNPRRGRREEEDYLAALDLVLECRPDVLVLHEGPVGGPSFPGNDLLRERLQHEPTPLVVCGHVHWESPRFEIAPGRSVLNVESRAVVLERT